jgi:RNase P protein component
MKHWDLIPALKVYNILLDKYRERLGEFGFEEDGSSVEEMEKPELADLRALLLAAEEWIKKQQEERDESLPSMQVDIKSWDERRLHSEVEERVSAYDHIPKDYRKNQWGEHSLILLGFTRVLQKERQYILERIRELTEVAKQKGYDSGDFVIDVRVTIMKALATVRTEDELWELMKKTLPNYPTDHRAKIEYLFYGYIERFRQQQTW